jgi:hypothetical protein
MALALLLGLDQLILFHSSFLLYIDELIVNKVPEGSPYLKGRFKLKDLRISII